MTAENARAGQALPLQGARGAGDTLAPMHVVWLLLLLLFGSPIAAQASLAGRPRHPMELAGREDAEGYAGSDSCRECHAANHASWHASFHRTMTQAPSPAAILAPFEGTTPALEGVAWELAREGDSYFATPLASDGRRGGRTRVMLTTGSHHYQIYWLASPASGRLEQLPLVWHLGERAWVPRKAMFLIPPGPSGSETDRWQESCVQCHATNGTPRHPDGGATRVAELGIACEACHGPGAAHVAWRRTEESKTAEEQGTGLVDPSTLDPLRSTEVCGQCHGIHPFLEPGARERWRNEGFAFRPGDDLAATRTRLSSRIGGEDEREGEAARGDVAALRAFLAREPETVAELLWSDGQVRVSGREYNGLAESACFERGSGEKRMSCLSCHEMHPSAERVAAGWTSDQLKPGMDGPAACLGCHARYAEPDAMRAHTHHASGSSGSDCLNCHMPYTTYGLTKAIRSHTITIPRVAESLATGRPNACNQCHLDRSLGWAADALAEWYGHARPELDADQRTRAASVLWTLSGDAGQRALMAWSLGWEPARAVSGTGWMPYLVSTLLLDEYDAVRWIAMRTARLDPRHADLELDFCQELEEQRNQVRETVLSTWLRDGLDARAEQREAVLVREDRKLDEETFRRLYGKRDQRPVRLAE